MSRLLTIRNLMWALALGITLWLSWHAPEQESIIQAKRQSGKTIMPSQQNATGKHVGEFALVPRVDVVDVESNLFAVPVKKVVQQFKPTLPQPKKIKPTAPPFPFKYLGSVVEEGQTKIFMKQDEQLLAVKVGDEVDGRYKLIAIEKMGNRSTLKFLYLPMKLTQTMVVNNAN